MNTLSVMVYLIISPIVSAQSLESVAILDIEGRGISAIEASSLTDRLRADLVRTGRATIIEQALRDAIAALPTEFTLWQNYPNPFNPTTHLAFALARPGEIRLSVYNLLGQEIVILAEGLWDMGQYEITWSGRDQAGRNLPSGLYIAVMRAEGRLYARKMVLLK